MDSSDTSDIEVIYRMEPLSAVLFMLPCIHQSPARADLSLMALARWAGVPGISSQGNQPLISSLFSAIRVKTKAQLQALETPEPSVIVLRYPQPCPFPGVSPAVLVCPKAQGEFGAEPLEHLLSSCLS